MMLSSCEYHGYGYRLHIDNVGKENDSDCQTVGQWKNNADLSAGNLVIIESVDLS